MSALGALCEPSTGEECEEVAVVRLPPEGLPLLDGGTLLTCTYADHDGVVWEHEFEAPPVLYLWREGLIVNTSVTEDGFTG